MEDQYAEEQQNQQIPQKYIDPLRDRDSVIWQLDLKDIAENIKIIFRGYKWSEEENKYVLDNTQEALMNEKGIRAVEGFLTSVVHRVTLLTNLEDETVRREAESLADSLAVDFFFNRKKYGIEFENMNLIYGQLKWLAFNSLMSSKNGGFQQFMTRTHHINETISHQPNQGMGYQNQEPKKKFIFF